MDNFIDKPVGLEAFVQKAKGLDAPRFSAVQSFVDYLYNAPLFPGTVVVHIPSHAAIIDPTPAAPTGSRLPKLKEDPQRLRPAAGRRRAGRVKVSYATETKATTAACPHCGATLTITG
jgi:hypothetical protein